MRDHVGQGYGKISLCSCTSVFCNAETPCPRVSCEVRVFVCELSTHLACLKIGVSRGCQDQLSHSPLIISQVSNQSPVISFPLGRVSLRSLLALPWIPFTNGLPIGLGLRCTVRQVFPPSACYQGGDKVASGRRRG